MTDLHIHTSISHDSKENAENYVLRAIAQSEKYLGFAEHLDGDGANLPPDLERYDEIIKNLKIKYPDVGILKGIELGFADTAAALYRKILAENDFDYAILSVHTLPGRGDCYYPSFYNGWSARQSYEAYLQAVLGSARADLDFHIIGHLGYISRYAPYVNQPLAYKDFKELFDRILLSIIERGICLEINTSAGGLDRTFVTETRILERYIELGGKDFTFGSDAHGVSRYGQNASAVKEFLLSHGINHICRFEKRLKIYEPI